MDQNSLYNNGFLGNGKEVKEHFKILKGQLIQSKVLTLVELRQLWLATVTKSSRYEELKMRCGSF